MVATLDEKEKPMTQALRILADRRQSLLDDIEKTRIAMRETNNPRTIATLAQACIIYQETDAILLDVSRRIDREPGSGDDQLPI